MSADGGPAFPTDNEAQTGNNTWHFAGMSLRDYFAAKALPFASAQYAEHGDKHGWAEGWREGVALDAYAMADAMLKVRNA